MSELRPATEGEAAITSSTYRRAWVCSALLGASWSSHFGLELALELARSTCAGVALDPDYPIGETAREVLSSRAETRLTGEGIILLAEHAERTWRAVQEQGSAVDRLYEEMHTGG